LSLTGNGVLRPLFDHRLTFFDCLLHFVSPCELSDVVIIQSKNENSKYFSIFAVLLCLRDRRGGWLFPVCISVVLLLLVVVHLFASLLMGLNVCFAIRWAVNRTNSTAGQDSDGEKDNSSDNGFHDDISSKVGFVHGDTALFDGWCYLLAAGLLRSAA
jgi:hypothetical protein